MCIHLLKREIEGLRSEMIKVAERKGSLIDPQVIALSQQLDQLLVTMQRLQRAKPPLESRPCNPETTQETHVGAER